MYSINISIMMSTNTMATTIRKKKHPNKTLHVAYQFDYVYRFTFTIMYTV